MPRYPLASSPEPSIDELLRLAKGDLRRADALSSTLPEAWQAGQDIAPYHADPARNAARTPPPPKSSFLSDMGTNLREQPYEAFKGFLSGAKDPAIRVAKRVGEHAMGLGQMITTPVHDTARPMADALARRMTFGNTPDNDWTPTAKGAFTAVTGVDPSSAAPEMAVDALAGLLLMRGGGVKGPNLGRAPGRLPDVAPTGRGATGPFSPLEPSVGPWRPPPPPPPPAPIPVSRLSPQTQAGMTQQPIAMGVEPSTGPVMERYAPNRSGYTAPPAPAPPPAAPPDPLSAWLAKYGRQAPEPAPPAAAPTSLEAMLRGAEAERNRTTRSPIDPERIKLRAPLPQPAPLAAEHITQQQIARDVALGRIDGPPGGAPPLSDALPFFGTNEGTRPPVSREPLPTFGDDVHISPEQQDALWTRKTRAPETPVEGGAVEPSPVSPPAPTGSDPAPAFDLKAALTPPKPKLSAQDVSAMFKRREKFAKRSPEGFKAGMHDALDRSGVEYTRAQNAFKAGEIPNEQARDLGKLLKATERDAIPAAGDPARQMVIRDAGAFSRNPEAGGVDPALLANLLRVGGGAAIGSYFDPDDRLRGAGIGAAVGGATLFPGVTKNLARGRLAAMLSGPAQLKNIVGNLGVATNTAAERTLTHGPRAGGKVISEFFSPQTARDVGDAFRRNSPISRMDLPNAADNTGALSLPFRTMGAIDEGAQAALTRGGVDDAATRTFTADPQSKLGQAAMSFRREGGDLASIPMPFMKTAINQVEAGTMPIEALRRLGEMTPELRKQTLAKVALLGGWGAAGGAYGSSDFAKKHPKLAPWLAAFTGSGMIPFALSQQFARARADGKNEPQALAATGSALQDQLPMPSEWAFSPSSVLASLVPPVGRLMNPDTIQRDTSGSVFGPAMARLPFLSRRLPAKRSGRRPRKS